MSARMYIEGGGDSKELHVRCRRGFRMLLESCGFQGKMPQLVACGSRSATYDDFKTAHGAAAPGEYVAMIVDSEDAVQDIEKTWEHLKARDGWDKPSGADDEQVLLMVTCMETWIVSDRDVLQRHYGSDLQETALPAQVNMEDRNRDAIQEALVHATRNCSNAYQKGKRSFEILGKLTPETLGAQLPSFKRCRRILGDRL